MKKRLLSMVTALALAVTTMWGGAVSGKVESAHGATSEGGLLWSFADSSISGMIGVSSPALSEDEKYIYLTSGKNLYKVNAETGEKAGTAVLSSSTGYYKFAPVAGGGKLFIPLGGAKIDIVDAGTMSVVKTVTYGQNQKNYQSLTPVTYHEEDNAVYLGSWYQGAGGTYAKVSLDDYSVTEMAAPTDNGFYWSGACADGDYVVFGSVSAGSDSTPATGDAKLYAWKKPESGADAAVTEGKALAEVTLAGSGSICSTVVKHEGKYYFTSKGGGLYEAAITEDANSGEISIQAEMITTLAGASTCTPVIHDGKAYIGSKTGSGGMVEEIELASGTVTKQYGVPADVKALTITDEGRIYTTYNSAPGGIYDVLAGKDYFTPHSTMQNYCISGIAVGTDGTLYYTNDSNNLMAVCDVDKLITAQWTGADAAGKLVPQSYTGKAVTPAVMVKGGAVVLTAGTDYTVAYQENIYPGEAAAVVKGKGTYKGEVILDFTIAAPVVAAQTGVVSGLFKKYNRIKTTWNGQAVAGAAVKYKVERKKGNGAWETLYSDTAQTSLHDKKLAAGKKYTYRITPFVTVNDKVYEGAPMEASVYTLKKAAKVKVKKASKKKITVSWQNMQGETGYQISRTAKKSKTKVIKTIKKSNAKSVKLKVPKKKKQYYKVRAYKVVNGKKIYGPWSQVKAYTLK